MTKVYKIGPDARASAEALRHAAEVLRRGGLVGFPTETVYGLGANALDPVAVARIFAAKGRPANNPLIVHVARVERARELVTEWPAAAEPLAARFWPGPLTLVLGRRPNVPVIVAAGAETLAVARAGASGGAGAFGSGRIAVGRTKRESLESDFADDGRACTEELR